MPFRYAASRLALLATVTCFSVPATCDAQGKQPAPSTAAGHTWKLERKGQTAPLTDYRTGQTRAFKMMTMLVPEGWSMQVSPGPNFSKIDCNNTSGRFVIAAFSPDKGTGILVLPATASIWSNNQAYLQQKASFSRQWKVSSCTIEQPMSLAQGLRLAAPKLVQGSQPVGEVQPIPGLSAQLPQIVADANQHLGGGSRITAEAGRLRLSGNINGRQCDIWLLAMTTQRTDPAPGGGQVIISDIPLLAVEFAPPGELDRNDKLLSTLLSSVQIDPEWIDQMQGYVAKSLSTINGAEQTVARIHQQMAQDNANAAAQQQAIRNGVSQYRSQVMSNVANQRSAALDHSSQQFALYMGDQAIYKDPSTGQRVQMSSGYDHVWASSTGNNNEYIMTDSASYNPNGNAGSAGWTQMQMEH